MGLMDEIVTVVIVAFVLTGIEMVSYSIWSFLFALLLSTVIATWIAKQFASNQKTIDSNGKFAKTSRVYVYVVMGIVISSIFGSFLTSYLVEILNQGDFGQIFGFSFAAALLVYVYVKARLY